MIKCLDRKCPECGQPSFQRYVRGGEQSLGGSAEMDPVGPSFCKAGCEQSLGG